MRLLLFLLVLVAAALGTSVPRALAGPSGGRVEVLEISGIIDGPVEHAVRATLRDAEAEGARLVVFQIDSPGAISEDRSSRLLEDMQLARVPIAAWIPPGGEARNTAAIMVIGAQWSAMAPGSTIGPIETSDLRSAAGRRSIAVLERFQGASRIPFRRAIGPAEAVRRKTVDARAATVTEVLQEVEGKTVVVRGRSLRVVVDPDKVFIRFRKLGIVGGMLHAAAKPSISYLLLLVGLVGVVFELFHPSTGPAGVAGLLALALSVYGIVTLGGAWGGFALIVLGVAGFSIDLWAERLGIFTLLGFFALGGGSVLLYSGPFLRTSPWVLAFGVLGMSVFMLGAMTRVLRDLRAMARGELEVRDPHPHAAPEPRPSSSESVASQRRSAEDRKIQDGSTEGGEGGPREPTS